jgi:hypothetical protein
MIHEGSGAHLIGPIAEAPRALVFISVPWSGPERHARHAFYAAAEKLEGDAPDLCIHFFRLDVDDDEASQRWLLSLGFPQFAGFGVGSLLWLEHGKVISSEVTANSLGVEGVVGRTGSLWKTR